MGLIERTDLIKQISPPLDTFLATQLIDEFISIERRYIQRDWEPAELDGGQFCEVAARVLYQQDSGTLNLGKPFSDCLDYVESQHAGVNHVISPRHDAIHLAKLLKVIYKFRSQRGAVHISASYSPNHMDARVMVETCRWAFAELLRMFWNGDRDAVAKAIRELLQFDVPCIGKFDDAILVQRTDLNPEEEVLVLLHFAGEQGFSRKELGRHAKCPPQRVSDAVKALTASNSRQVIYSEKAEVYRLTDLGSKRIREQLAAKLLLD